MPTRLFFAALFPLAATSTGELASAKLPRKRTATAFLYECQYGSNQSKWDALVDKLKAWPLLPSDTVAVVSYSFGPNGTFAYNEDQPRCGELIERYGIPTIAALGVKQTPTITAHFGMEAVQAVLYQPSVQESFIADAIARAKQLRLSGYIVDVELPNATEEDGEAMVAFIGTFSKALHAEGMTLGTAIGRCGVRPGSFHVQCSNYSASDVDHVVTMRSYWAKAQSLEKFESIVDSALKNLGGKYIVGIDKGFGSPDRVTTNESTAILKEALQYVGGKGIDNIAIWGTKQINQLFMVTVSEWLDAQV